MIYRWRDLKKHPYIIPIYVLCIADVIFMGYMGLRCARKNPEVTFRRSNTEPWEDYRNNVYKVIPLYVLCAADLLWLSYMGFHCARYNPDISWKRPYKEPWESHRNKIYKLRIIQEGHRAEHVCKAPIYRGGDDLNSCP